VDKLASHENKGACPEIKEYWLIKLPTFDNLRRIEYGTGVSGENTKYHPCEGER
jgi:hypothetical protein